LNPVPSIEFVYKIPYHILLHKLASYGVSGHLYEWFADYLSGRRQRVVVDGATCNWVPVTSGVPQGSLLGPILFVIFINYLTDILPDETLAALYADDTKLYKSITSHQ
jgi:sarcosine oxidase/L-pipecolate oxidase